MGRNLCCGIAGPFPSPRILPAQQGGLSAPVVSTVQVPRTVISMSRQSAFFQPLTSPSSINRLEYLPQKRCLADEVKKPTLEQEIRSQALLRFGCCCAECAEHSEQTYEAIKQKDTRIDRQFYDRCPLSPLVSTTGLICASTSKKTEVSLWLQVFPSGRTFGSLPFTACLPMPGLWCAFRQANDSPIGKESGLLADSV